MKTRKDIEQEQREEDIKDALIKMSLVPNFDLVVEKIENDKESFRCGMVKSIGNPDLFMSQGVAYLQTDEILRFLTKNRKKD